MFSQSSQKLEFRAIFIVVVYASRVLKFVSLFELVFTACEIIGDIM